jgi:hypothetical protein
MMISGPACPFPRGLNRTKMRLLKTPTVTIQDKPTEINDISYNRTPLNCTFDILPDNDNNNVIKNKNNNNDNEENMTIKYQQQKLFNKSNDGNIFRTPTAQIKVTPSKSIQNLAEPSNIAYQKNASSPCTPLPSSSSCKIPTNKQYHSSSNNNLPTHNPSFNHYHVSQKCTNQFQNNRPVSTNNHNHYEHNNVNPTITHQGCYNHHHHHHHPHCHHNHHVNHDHAHNHNSQRLNFNNLKYDECQLCQKQMYGNYMNLNQNSNQTNKNAYEVRYQYQYPQYQPQQQQQQQFQQQKMLDDYNNFYLNQLKQQKPQAQLYMNSPNNNFTNQSSPNLNLMYTKPPIVNNNNYMPQVPVQSQSPAPPVVTLPPTSPLLTQPAQQQVPQVLQVPQVQQVQQAQQQQQPQQVFVQHQQPTTTPPYLFNYLNFQYDQNMINNMMKLNNIHASPLTQSPQPFNNGSQQNLAISSTTPIHTNFGYVY